MVEPTPINMSAIIQEALQAQPPGVTAADVAQAVQQAMSSQPGVTEAQVGDAIAKALSESLGVTEAQVGDAIAQALRAQTPGLTEAQVADTIAKALSERPGVTGAQVGDAIAQALRAQTPGLTEAQVAGTIAKALSERPGVTEAQVGDAIAKALAEKPGVTEAQVAGAIAQALRAQTPGLTEAEVSEAIAKALADRPGLTQEDIQKAVADAVAMAMPTPAPMMEETMMMEEFPDLLVRDVFFFATLTPPTGCSFWGCRVSFNMFDGLVAIDNTSANKDLVPNLAESWEVSEDGMAYTFKIRPGVNFTTGRPLNANAVQASFQRAFDVFEREGLSSTQAWFTLTDSIEAVDDMTFKWTLTDPYAPLLPLLTSKDLLIVDAEEALAHEETDEKGRDYGVKWATERSIGTGPFMVESFTAEQRLVMAKNPDYWGGHDGVSPSVERVIDVHVPEPAVGALQLSAGEVDVALQLDPISLQSFEGNDDVEVFTYPSLITCNFLVDRRIPPISDPRGFQAIRHAINYQGLRDVVALGLADVHQSLILPGMSGHDPAIATKYYHNPELARQLLSAAGFPDGFDVQIQLRTGACGSVVYQKALEFFQNDLKAIGVNAEIVQSTSSRFWGEISDEKMRDFGISGLGATYFDADQPATWRALRECNLLGLDDVEPEIAARLEELTNMGRVETDPQKRHVIYREMSELMVDNCGEITVLQVRDTVAHRSNISNIVPAAHAFTPEFRYMRKSQ
jgi:peptide/nickel transport system substrate-binding protein